MTPNVCNTLSSAFPLKRPQMMAAAAKFCAGRYIRARDLPGAVPGLLAGRPDAILPRLLAAERQCEDERRAGSAAYRPARHLQILAALLAEASALQQADKKKGATLMAAPKPLDGNRLFYAETRSSRPALEVCRPQAKASGSDALRVAI